MFSERFSFKITPHQLEAMYKRTPDDAAKYTNEANLILEEAKKLGGEKKFKKVYNRLDDCASMLDPTHPANCEIFNLLRNKRKHDDEYWENIARSEGTFGNGPLVISVGSSSVMVGGQNAGTGASMSRGGFTNCKCSAGFGL